MRCYIVMTVLAACGIAVSGCRQSAEVASREMGDELDALQKRRGDIVEELRDIERARALLEESTKKELNEIRLSIENIQHALTEIETRLVAIGAMENPTEPAKRRRLHPAVSAVLGAFFLGSTLLYLKLRHMRRREAGQTRAEVIVREKPKPPPEA